MLGLCHVGVRMFDAHPDKALRGSVFKDGTGGTGLRMGLTLNEVEQIVL